MSKSWKVGDLLEFWSRQNSQVPPGTKLLLVRRTVERSSGVNHNLGGRWRITWYGIRMDSNQEHKIIPSTNIGWKKFASLRSSAKT